MCECSGGCNVCHMDEWEAWGQDDLAERNTHDDSNIDHVRPPNTHTLGNDMRQNGVGAIYCLLGDGHCDDRDCSYCREATAYRLEWSTGNLPNEVITAYGERGVLITPIASINDDIVSLGSSRSSRGRRGRRARARERERQGEKVIGVVRNFNVVVSHLRPARNTFFESFIDENSHGGWRHAGVHGRYFMQEASTAAKEKHFMNFTGEDKRIRPTEALDMGYTFVAQFVPNGTIGSLLGGEIDPSGLELNSGAGLSYAARGMRKKRDAVAIATEEATSKLRRLEGGVSVIPGLYWAGGRGKLVSATSDDAITKGRLIWMPECDDTLLQLYSYERIAPILSLGCGPWSIGDSYYYGGANAMSHLFRRCVWGLYPDYTRFDGSIVSDLIILATSIERRIFYDGDGERDDAYWSYIVNALVKGGIVMPDASVRMVDKGMKSGNVFTSISESIANAIMLYAWLSATMIDRCGFSREVAETYLPHFMVKTLGDDAVIGVPEELEGVSSHFTMASLTEYIYANFHVSVSQAKAGEGPIGDLGGVFDDTTQPDGPSDLLGNSYHYLGKHLYMGRAWRPYKETYALCLYPEYTPESADEALACAIGHFYDCGNRATEHVMWHYIQWLVRRGAQVPANSHPRIPEIDPNVIHMISKGLPKRDGAWRLAHGDV